VEVREAVAELGERFSRLPRRARQLLAHPGQRLLRTREPRVAERVFRRYAARPFSGDVLLVLNESQTRAYTRDPDAAWKLLAIGKVTVRLTKSPPARLFDASETTEVGRFLAQELGMHGA
jgi:hypothetical protein